MPPMAKVAVSGWLVRTGNVATNGLTTHASMDRLNQMAVDIYGTNGFQRVQGTPITTIQPRMELM